MPPDVPELKDPGCMIPRAQEEIYPTIILSNMSSKISDPIRHGQAASASAVRRKERNNQSVGQQEIQTPELRIKRSEYEIN